MYQGFESVVCYHLDQTLRNIKADLIQIIKDLKAHYNDLQNGRIHDYFYLTPRYREKTFAAYFFLILRLIITEIQNFKINHFD